MKTILFLSQWLVMIMAAPFFSGLITKIKNDLRMRKGPGVLQPYYNLAKLFAKGEVISENASWIFKAAPFVVFACAILVSLMVFVNSLPIALSRLGDFFVIIFIFALGRFFLSLAGLDTASAFAGMGSSREMFISSLAEPVAFLSIFAIALKGATTSLPELLGSPPGLSVSLVMALGGLFMVVLAETSRLPVDNQETHLELTMIHEAMVLEYSGPRLALIESASYIKQIIFFSLIVNFLFPAPLAQVVTQASGYLVFILALAAILAKIAVLACVVAFLEVSIAKMRLFRAADFLAFAFVLSLMAVVAAAIGI